MRTHFSAHSLTGQASADQSIAGTPIDPHHLPTYGEAGSCIHVSQDPTLSGTAMPSLATAIESAVSSGIECVIVHPGIYSERTCIGSNIRVIGAGRSKSIIRFERQNGICIHAGTVSFRDLTMESVATESGFCLSADSRDGAVLLEVTNCRLHLSDSPVGLIVANGSQASIKNSIFDGSSGHGILVKADGRLTAYMCRVRKNTKSGISVENGGVALIERTQLCFNGHAGIQALGSAALIRCNNTMISDNGTAGIKLSDCAQAEIERCEVYSNHYGLLLVNSEINTRDSLFSHNGYCGIYYTGENLRGTISNCSFLENGNFGVFCDDARPQTSDWEQTALTVRHSSLGYHRAAAIYLGDCRNGSVENCTVFGDNTHVSGGKALIRRHNNRGTIPNNYRLLSV